uniref:Phospholipase A2-like central domain-containing protein n=1 Tax=Fundulus heteroclitus TaxID=8078 RepID=A0A3Q2PJL9_FUNHE
SHVRYITTLLANRKRDFFSFPIAYGCFSSLCRYRPHSTCPSPHPLTYSHLSVFAGTNDKCQAAVCECDRVAAHCFARYTYNPDNKYLDPKFLFPFITSHVHKCKNKSESD